MPAAFSLCFLLGAGLFPRLTLLFCWMLGGVPTNNTPFALDVICAIFCPRGLIAWWLWEAGAHPLLVGVFAVLQILEWVRGSMPTVRVHRSSE